MLKIMVFILSYTLIMTSNLWARPEYANRIKLQCSLCHVNPTGGGPRTLMGKAFGSSGYELAETSLKDQIYGDFRALYFMPERPIKSKNGAALMKASVAAQIKIKEKEGKKLKALFHYDFGQLSSKPVREAYIKWEKSETQLIVGRFYLPFGLLTDEHRTYTKIQVNTSLRDFEMGALWSQDINESLHYDFSLSNGSRSSGGGFTENGDQSFAVNFNVRWNPTLKPFLLGFSALHQASQKYRPQPLASSLYGVWAIDRTWESLPKLDILAEVVLADNFNRSEFNPWLPIYFTGGHATWGDELQLSSSLGYLLEVKWELNPAWKISYKFDEILLDARFEGDRFLRQGLGVIYQWDANSQLYVKLEKADVGRSDIDTTQILGSQNALLAMLRVWL